MAASKNILAKGCIFPGLLFKPSVNWLDLCLDPLGVLLADLVCFNQLYYFLELLTALVKFTHFGQASHDASVSLNI